MKCLRIFGPAAAVAALALVVAGTASATVLCKTNASTATCGAPNHVKAGETIEAALEGLNQAVFEDMNNNVKEKCPSSVIRGTTENTGSATETVKWKVPAIELSFSNCGTTTINNSAAGKIEMEWIPKTDNATLKATGFKIETNPFGSEWCIYEFGATSTDIGVLKGANAASISVNAVIPRVNTCSFGPNPIRLTGTYTVREPNPLYVTQG
jgi:hypothetical protein